MLRAALFVLVKSDTSRALPGAFLSQSVEEGVGVEELGQVEGVGQESLAFGALHPTLDVQTHGQQNTHGHKLMSQTANKKHK